MLMIMLIMRAITITITIITNDVNAKDLEGKLLAKALASLCNCLDLEPIEL